MPLEGLLRWTATAPHARSSERSHVVPHASNRHISKRRNQHQRQQLPDAIGSPQSNRGKVGVSASAAQEPVTMELPQLLPLDENYDVAHTFTWYANWLIRGRLMLGRYPFVEPSRCIDRKQGEKQIGEILDAGITTFACLQEELPPQPEIKTGGVHGFLPYYAAASLMAKSREGPIPQEELMGLRNQYLDKFLPARKERQQQENEIQQQLPTAARPPMQFVHEPITDLSIPDPAVLDKRLDDLEERIRRGEVIYLHCWGGRGRAGTVGACLLNRLYGLPAEECLERVQRGYSTRNDPERRYSPETDEQRAFVRSFIEQRGR